MPSLGHLLRRQHLTARLLLFNALDLAQLLLYGPAKSNQRYICVSNTSHHIRYCIIYHINPLNIIFFEIVVEKAFLMFLIKKPSASVLQLEMIAMSIPRILSI